MKCYGSLNFIRRLITGALHAHICIVCMCTRDVSCSRLLPMSSDDSGEPIDPVRFHEVAAAGVCLWTRWDRQAVFERHLAAQRPLNSFVPLGGADTLAGARVSAPPVGSSGSQALGLPAAAIPAARPLSQPENIVIEATVPEGRATTTSSEGRDLESAHRKASDISEGSDSDFIVTSRHGEKKPQFGQRHGGDQSHRAKAIARQSRTGQCSTGSRRHIDDVNGAQPGRRKRRKKSKW